MRGAKHGPRVLGLAMLGLLGLMALGAGGAQGQTLPGASTQGEFLVNLGAALLATVTASQIGEGYILVLARDLEFSCTSFDVTEGKIKTSTDAIGKVTFLGCLSFSHSTGELLPCELKGLGTITAEVLVLPIIHGEDRFLLFEPIEGAANLTIVTYKSGTECPLPLNNAVTGSITAKVDALDAVTQLILFNENLQLLTGDKLTFGGNAAYVIGHSEVKLTGSHEGQKLGLHEFDEEALEKEHEHKAELTKLEEGHKEALAENPEPLGEPEKTNKAGVFLINLGSALLATVTASQIGEGYIFVPARDLKLSCTSFDLTEGKIKTSTDAIGKVTFLGCLSFSLSTGELLPCELKSLGAIEAEALVLPITHGGDSFLLFEPIEGAANLTIVTFKSGTECPLALNNAVTGSITAKVDALDAVTQLILFNENLQLLTGDKLTFGGNPTYVFVHVETELTGSHEGQKLGLHESSGEGLEEVHDHEAELTELELHKAELTELEQHKAELTELSPEALTEPGKTSSAGTFLINLGSALLSVVTGQSGLGSLLVPTRNLNLECHQSHVEEAKINNSADASGTVVFLECQSLSLSTGEPLPCETTTLGTIKASFLALPISHGGEGFVLFEPQEGTSFTTVSYKAGTECPLPLNNSVNGSFAALVDQLDGVEQRILFSPAIQLLTGDVSRFNFNPEYLDGEAVAFLVGEHEGQKLGIH